MATSETRFYHRFGSTSCCAVCQATSALHVQLQRHFKWAQEPVQWLLSECIGCEWIWIHLKAHVDMCVWCWGLSPARCSCSPWFRRWLLRLMAPDWNAWELQKDLNPLRLGCGMCFDHGVEIPGCYEVQLCRRGVIDWTLSPACWGQTVGEGWRAHSTLIWSSPEGHVTLSETWEDALYHNVEQECEKCFKSSVGSLHHAILFVYLKMLWVPLIMLLFLFCLFPCCLFHSSPCLLWGTCYFFNTLHAVQKLSLAKLNEMVCCVCVCLKGQSYSIKFTPWW